MAKPKEKKKKPVWQQYIAMACMMLIGAVCGVMMVMCLEASASAERSTGEELLSLAALFVSLYISIFLQTAVHEAGHLVFGLLSGYRFSSYRVGSLMWVKESGKLRFRRMTVAGTGGQCLMAPPELQNGMIPVVLYNLGGSLMNIIVSLLCLCGYVISNGLLSTALLIAAIIGFAFAVINGVPMRMGIVDNDGYNAFALRKDRNALHAFWIQMKINEQLSHGVRLKDMPEEWFSIPEEAQMHNSMVAALGVFACNRLMDQQRFAEADALMAQLLDMNTAIVGLHRQLMICDRVFCELIGQCRQDVLDELLDKSQKKFMKSMKNFPSVLRTEYAYALLAEHDKAEAAQIMTQFDKCARNYPYSSDIQSERELLQIAAQRAQS